MTTPTKLTKLAALPTSIAADVYPKGVTLRCERCGAEWRATSNDCGTFLARGWPRCCGLTMRSERVTP